MSTYQCVNCERQETIGAFIHEACSSCGGRLRDLDAEAKAKVEAALVAEQNDVFRKALNGVGAEFTRIHSDIKGQVLLTQGVSCAGPEFQAEALAAVAGFETFNEDNDPYGDHTFGVVTVQGKKLFWKIDLYDLSFEYGSEHPSDPAVTRRALTLMLPSEY